MLKGMSKLDRDSFKPLYVQLSDILLGYIDENKLQHADALPSENELLAHLGVSRNTVRLAIDRLVQMGVAEKIRGQGTFYIENKRTLSIDYHSGFEGSVERSGLEVTNKLIDMQKVTGSVDWIDGLNETHWEETILIRRLKITAGELLAIEERLLPGYVVKRFSRQDFETQNINPDLLNKHLDTHSARFAYTFISQQLSKEECKLAALPCGINYLRRIGEYRNSLNEQFMFSRLTIISDRIKLRYDYTKQEDGFVVD